MQYRLYYHNTDIEKTTPSTMPATTTASKTTAAAALTLI